MNSKKFLQTEGNWAGLGYPKKPWYIRNCGCGEVSIANILIEMERYAKYTPKTIQPYCRQFAAPNGDGTYWSGIPKMMEHYGLTNVKECTTMSELWKELAKGERVAVYLMGSNKGGSKKVHWTYGGHFVVSVGYKSKKNKKGKRIHYLYVKDSYSNSSLRNKWITYEGNMKGDIIKVWTGKLNDEQNIEIYSKLTVDGIGGFNTILATQKFFGTEEDGYIGGQQKKQYQYYPSITAVEFGGGGSNLVKVIQAWCGVKQDGILGKGTIAAWQYKLREMGYLDADEKVDGIFGVQSMKAWQKFLNNKGKDLKPKDDTTSTESTPTITEPVEVNGKINYKVIDISFNQKNVNFKKVKADGIGGVIIRCGFRGYESGKLQKDSQFETHIKNAYKAGLPVGVYFFTEAINAQEGREEADYTVALVKKMGIPISYPIAIDTEAINKKTARADKISKSKRTKAVKAFCERIKELGYEPMIYASTSWLNSKLNMSKLPYKVWCAQYYTKCEYKGEIVMWQYSSKGKVNGISGNVDMNHCYIRPNPINPTKKKAYVGAYPTDAEIKSASRKGMKKHLKSWSKDVAANPKYRYVYYSEKYGTECAICHPHDGKNEGWQCIGLGAAAMHHGLGAPTTCNCHVVAQDRNDHLDLFDAKTDAKALKLAKRKFGTNDLMIIRSKDGNIPKDEWQTGDFCCQIINGNIFKHVFTYLGNGKIIDASKRKNKKDDIAIRSYNNYTAGVIVRYTGGHSYIKLGDEGKAVTKLQNYLDWYFDGAFFAECGKADGVFGENTEKWVKKMQTDFFGEKEADGTVGAKTIAKMKEVKK